jgi:hypothetical protein
MPDREDTLAHVRHIDITVADFSRWEEVGQRLEVVTPTVIAALAVLKADPCKLQLGRVGSAARYAASICDQPLRTEAIALAEELERRSV